LDIAARGATIDGMSRPTAQSFREVDASQAPRRHFASDNNAGIHPDVLAAIVRANAGHTPAYGDDAFTRSAIRRVREHFGAGADVHFVFGGTGANVLALRALTRPHQAVICSDKAHIQVDECGAPEHFTGCKLLPASTHDGKLRPEDVARELHGVGDEHHVQPRVLAISQTTERGTVYTPREVRELADYAHAHGLVLHVDGARLANAAAALKTTLAAITTDAGVDALSLGGTKNGAMGAEAVVFLNGTQCPDFKFIRKQGMQLASKMRFIAVQIEALLTDDLWRRNAEHANAMAQRLARGLRSIPKIELSSPVEANAIFARVPREKLATLRERFFFYVWDDDTSEVRWMTAFDTTEEDVDAFLAALRELLR
jgi:threonine aldolase